MKPSFNRSFALPFFLAVVFVSPSLVLAQAAPQAAPAPSSGSAPADASQFQLKLPVPLVIEDVIALDNKERPVHGLQAADFIVTENGKRVQLSGFEEHAPASAPAAIIKPPPLGANIFTNVPDVPQSTSLNILLLDGLNTPLTAQARVHQQMLEFLKALPPGTRVAIFGLGIRLYLLQGFTDDPAILRAAIEARNGGPRTSPLLGQRASQDESNPENDSVLDYIMKATPYGQSASTALHTIEAQQENLAIRQRTVYTLQAMNQLGRYLSALPGHKSLIWFSGSFPLNILPNDQLTDQFSQLNDFREAVRQTADLMARGRVAVYPVDARGLASNSSFNPAQFAVNHYEETHNRDAADAASKHFATDQTYAEYDSMEMMAANTGGKAFYNTGALKDVAEKIIGYGESYYTIAYTPTSPKFDGSYRKIVIKPGQLDMHYSYRIGYFADDPDAPSSTKRELPLSAKEVAMLNGVPNAIQVLFAAFLVPAEMPVDKLTQGGRPDDTFMKPPYLRYTVQYAIDIRSVQFTVDANSVHHGSVELAAYVYNREGNLINSTLSQVSLDLPGDRFAQILKQGVMTHQVIEAPAAGEYHLRLGVLDLANDHVGSLELSLANLKSLADLRAEAAKHGAPPAK